MTERRSRRRRRGADRPAARRRPAPRCEARLDAPSRAARHDRRAATRCGCRPTAATCCSSAPRAAASRRWRPASSSGSPRSIPVLRHRPRGRLRRRSRTPSSLGGPTRPPTRRRDPAAARQARRRNVRRQPGRRAARRPAGVLREPRCRGSQSCVTRTGRPHWLVVDEAHHLLPAEWEPGPLDAAAGAAQRPADHRASGPASRRSRCADVDMLIAVGKTPGRSARASSGKATRIEVPKVLGARPGAGAGTGVGSPVEAGAAS